MVETGKLKPAVPGQTWQDSSTLHKTCVTATLALCHLSRAFTEKEPMSQLWFLCFKHLLIHMHKLPWRHISWSLPDSNITILWQTKNRDFSMASSIHLHKKIQRRWELVLLSAGAQVAQCNGKSYKKRPANLLSHSHYYSIGLCMFCQN